MSDLQMISEDVLDLIVGSLHDLPSLAALALVSKLFNRLTLPYLYRHVSLVHGTSDVGNRHLRTLTASILKKPELAALVRRFTLRETYATEHLSEPPEDDENWTGWPQQCELDHMLRTAIDAQLVRGSDFWGPDADGPAGTSKTRAEIENEELLDTMAAEWFRVARVGCNEAAVLALLLPSLVNLQFLDIPSTIEWNGMGNEEEGCQTCFMVSMVERVSAYRATRMHWKTFSKLTDVMIYGGSNKYPEDPEMFAACINLPAVKRIYAFNVGNDGQSEDNIADPSFENVQPESSPVEFIQLRYSKLSSSNFSCLLEAPMYLKTLIYEMGNLWAMTDLDLSKMQQALEFQKENLERLHLSHASPNPFTEQDLFIQGITNDTLLPLKFADFYDLRHLRVAPVYLYGGQKIYLGDIRSETDEPDFSQDNLESTRMLLREALPPRLETLSFVQCNYYSMVHRVYISLKELLANTAEHFPHLREVSIIGQSFNALETFIEVLTALPWAANNIRLIIKHVKNRDLDSRELHREVKWGWDEDVEWADCRFNHNRRGPVYVVYDSNDC